MSDTPLRPTPWDDIPLENVTDTIKRRLFSGERMMLAHVHLDKGAIVPMHSHENATHMDHRRGTPFLDWRRGF